MELSKNYVHSEAEARWYQHWLDKGYFNSIPDDREPYTIVIPPPNVTGVLHMGHCLNNTIQDILIRHARMQGKNACWVPGTDHASIATEAKVVAMLREKGIVKSSLTRDEFMKYAWEWKEKYGGIILQQLKKLGCSPDWNRTAFTMDDDYYKSVIKVFVDLYDKGIIYRGLRMVNWDPVGKTALSDEEVIFKEVDSRLYFVKYPLAEDASRFVTVATTRPETILGDIAICVNPNDERYKELVGKEVIVPIINRKIPIIADEYVDAEFGTGALKITPAHDKNDNELGKKHKLQSINTLDAEGKFTAEELTGDHPSAQVLAYTGIDRFELRKKIAEDVKNIGLLDKTEAYKGQIGTSERTGAVIESRLSLQWFINMKKFLENNPETLSAVMDDTIRFHPDKTKNTYSHWLNTIKDWCISRQLWWGQQIPAWYSSDGNYVVAASKEEAVARFKSVYPASDHTNLQQDEDCLDTWFSSWLWPIQVFKGISHPNNKEINYYYPTNTLVTGQDIIFFWVARMIMAGFEYKKQIPFQDVYFTGMVRDKEGRKMSKQLGNSPDLLALIDKFGADAVRFGIMISSPAGNDLLFDESSLEQGRNFTNKLWNALKLIRSWESRLQTPDSKLQTPDSRLQTPDSKLQTPDSKLQTPDSKLQTPNSRLQTPNSKLQTPNFAIAWFDNRLAEAKTEVANQMQQFRLSEALKTIYSLIWDDFCSWYLEWVKPGFEQPIDAAVYTKTIACFDELMQLLHPFMPFVSEEIYHLTGQRSDDICIRQNTAASQPDSHILEAGRLLKQVITALRDARNRNQLKPKDTIKLYVQTAGINEYTAIESILTKQVNAISIEYTDTAIADTIVVAVEKDKFFIETEKQLNTAALQAELLKDLEYQKKFRESVVKKLSNERFVQNAKPEVVELERKKQEDAEARIRTIEESLKNL